MAAQTIPCDSARANIKCVSCFDSEGRLVLLPRGWVRAMLAKGITAVTLTDVSLRDAAPPTDGLTVTEAARLHIDDVDGITLEVARATISQACSAGKIRATGTGSRRRLDPDSFAAWRLARRERDLRRADQG